MGYLWYFTCIQLIGHTGLRCIRFHRKHSVYACDSVKTSWGKIEWMFFDSFDFFAKTLFLHEFLQSGGRNETTSGSNVLLWCYRLKIYGLFCVKLSPYDVFNRIMMPHTRSYYRVFVHTQVIIIPINRNNQGEEVLFCLSWFV
jgi:hypothetical protein